MRGVEGTNCHDFENQPGPIYLRENTPHFLKFNFLFSQNLTFLNFGAKKIRKKRPKKGHERYRNIEKPCTNCKNA